MSSKMIALKVLDGIFVAFAALLLLTVVGLSIDPLSGLIGMPLHEFQSFALFVLFSTLLLIHAIGTSDSAP